GLDVEPLAVHFGGFAAGHQPGAFLLPGRDIGEHRLLLALGDDRPQPGGLVERVAGRDLLGPLGELRHDLIMDRALHQQPGAGGANLAFAVEDAVLRAAPRGDRKGTRLNSSPVKTSYAV